MTSYDLSAIRRFRGDFVDLSIEGDPIPVIPRDFKPMGFLTEVFSFEMAQRPIVTSRSHTDFAEKCYVSRTGYTGEDGFEILLENPSAKVLWNILLHVGKGYRPRSRPAQIGSSNGTTTSSDAMPCSSRDRKATIGALWDWRSLEKGFPVTAIRS
jgi:hypothetical protein